MARCLSISLVTLSLIYLWTRLTSFYELKDYKARAGRTFSPDASGIRLQYDNYEMLHILTIAHAVSCIVLSGVIYFALRGSVIHAIDRRQYLAIMALSVVVTFAYFLAFIYVVLQTS